MKILVVEDERSIAEALKAILEREGYQVSLAFDGESGLDEIISAVYDLVLLDLMLPKLDGLSVLRKARALDIDVPVICLTARSQLDDKVTGLDQGADDYITKPFEVDELLARVRVQVRQSVNQQANLLSMGNLTLKTDSRELMSSEGKMTLSNKEFLLMEIFFHHPNQVLSKEQLITKVWGPMDDSEYNQLEVFMTFIRKKLRFLKANVEIKATRGLGYSMKEAEK
ncbi:DNA-binding response OmpR family regulator [Streptococcus gallinaceus]|uniref:response regulator transcription factor n=1 Tax=Streptococcus gallinaceus TaxID=165758 RepID=UPI00209CBF08|nr:response regulator transcription factor [Streptococcus gallinaceus]MCP1638375.1 DNA-binding response OmpR family regulator [Streptococcus gallinaceus]MCP1769538.1 DNA-binding response OmpR family regulator [Streptococcus gallinaceus]